jgi:hypothetical protein
VEVARSLAFEAHQVKTRNTQLIPRPFPPAFIPSSRNLFYNTTVFL